MAMALLLLLCVSPVIGQVDSERVSLKSYLKEHRLFQLYGELLEDELATSNRPQELTENTATDLASLYAWELNTKPDRFDYLSERLDELARDFPVAIPISTQITISYGRYRRAKDVFENWIRNRTDSDLKQQVNSLFANVVQRATDAMANIEGQLANTSIEPVHRRDLQSLHSRFQYLAAWARYYRSTTLDDRENRNALLHVAEEDFLLLLEISDSEVLLNISPQWWSLNSEWTCRLLLGLAMTSQSLGRSEQANFCFNLLTESRVPNSIRSSQRVWKFHSFVFPAQLEQADVMVRKSELNHQTIGDAGFWASVTIAGICWPDGQSPSRNMIRTGLCGLARANEFQVVDEIHEEYPGITMDGNDFFSLWMNGYAALKNSVDLPGMDSTPDKQRNLARAKVELWKALNSKSTVEPVFRARCRYHYGFALYSVREFVDAAEQFRQSSTILRGSDPPLAEHAAWMQCQALNRLAATDTGWTSSLSFALSSFQEQFPNSPNASQAAFMQILNRLVADPSLALSTLRSVEPTDTNYKKALFEICRLCYNKWRSKPDSDEPQRLALETLQSVDKYLSEVGNITKVHVDSEKLASVCLFAADVSVQQKKMEAARSWLVRCKEFLPAIQSANNIVSDYHFLLLTVSSSFGDRDTESFASDWLLRNTANTNHLRSALVSRARMLDLQWTEAIESGAHTLQRAEPVLDAYQRLVDEYRKDDSIDHELMAQAALLRLAELQTMAGRKQEARDSYSLLFQTKPNELGYVLGLARAETAMGNLADAIDHWRNIASSQTPGAELWLEAKYHLILSLLNGQPKHAQQIYHQTRLLVPNLPGSWLPRFDELESRFAE